MRFSSASTGTILDAIVLFIALGGTAFAEAATAVTIADRRRRRTSPTSTPAGSSRLEGA